MKALVWHQAAGLKLEDKPDPSPEGQEVLLRILQTGICGTDRSILVGKFQAADGTTLGHESVAVVERLGDRVSMFSKGDRVIINPTLYCGHCRQCQRGRLNFCENKAGTEVGVDYDGAFADLMVLPETFCHLIPEYLSVDRATLVEPLVCAMSNIKAGGVQALDRVGVIGGGPMGLLVAMVCYHYGAHVSMFEIDEYRAAQCREIMGYAADRVSVESAPGSQSEYDVIIDAVGNQLELAVRLAAPMARIVIMGFNDHAEIQVRPLEILQKGLTIVGAGDYNSHLFPDGIRLAKDIPLERLITSKVPISDFDEAFSSLSVNTENYSDVKVLITP